MKKIKYFTLFSVLALFMLPSVANACIQKLKPEKKEVKIGEVIKVKASVKWVHRKCLLEVDDVNFKFIGVKKLSMSDWKKKGRGKYEATIKVKILRKNAVIKMWRYCSRTHKHGTKLKFKVVK